jgi:small-conductance mechanosensitive channel
MSMAGSDITIEILKDIRDATRNTNTRLDSLETAVTRRLDGVTERLDTVTQRLDLVETTLLDLAEQHRFVVRYTKAIAERDTQLEPRLSALESRVEKLESK